MKPSGSINFQTSQQQEFQNQSTRVSQTTANQEQKKLSDLVSSSEKTLFKFQAGSPFDLSPDEVTIDPTKISIVYNSMFGPAEYHSIPISIISDITLDIGTLFGKLTIYQREFKDSPNVINYVERNDALYARKLLEGLVLAQTKNIDFSNLSTQEIQDYIEKLGSIPQ